MPRYSHKERTERIAMIDALIDYQMDSPERAADCLIDALKNGRVGYLKYTTEQLREVCRNLEVEYACD